MTEEIILVLLVGVAGALLLRVGARQLRNGVAWSLLGRLCGTITRTHFPILYWLAVSINLLLGGLMLLAAVGMFVP